MKKRTEIINYIINKCRFNTYLEIGVRNPSDNYNHINAEIKHGVDPKPLSDVTHKMTSDEFFKQNDSSVYDLIFIDGLHTEEQSYQDVSNALKHLNDGGVIVMHDCNPPDKHYVRPLSEYKGGGWCGGVYRAYIRSRFELQPDYNSCVIDEETGIGIITERHFDNKSIKYNESYLDYDVFSNNREAILNLVSFEELKNMI